MILLLAACGGNEITLVFEPDHLDFGEVDFAQEMPEGGYNPQEVTVRNQTEATVELTLLAYDTDHLCVGGFPNGDEATALGPLAEGSTYLLTIAICDYISGEGTTLVETQLDIGTDGKPSVFSLPISFTPIRDLDTGN